MLIQRIFIVSLFLTAAQAAVVPDPVVAQVIAPENIVFPADAGQVDVKLRYGAKGDGITDDTAALQRAIDEVRGIPETLYFPNGTYLISNSLGIFNGTAHSRDRFISYQGQSESGTIIKLANACDGFGDPSNPKTVFSVYQGQGSGDVMRSYVRNMTIDVGEGNAGAIGVRFMTNNTGGMYHVTVRSSDPGKAGKLGLDMSQAQNGPCLIKQVTIDGFDTGIESGISFSLQFEHIRLRHQKVCGMIVKSPSTIRGLSSVNTVTALQVDDLLTLIEGDFTGGDADGTAIKVNRPGVFLRDLKQSGYGHLLRDPDGKNIDGTSLGEWFVGQANALFPIKSPAKSLRLPIKETPEVPWETDLTKWAKADWPKPYQDMSDVLQSVIDEAAKTGKTTLYFPRRQGKYDYPKLGKPVRIHGSINHIIGMENIIELDQDITGQLKPTGFDTLPKPDAKALFTIENIASDVVVIERFMTLGKRKNNGLVYMFENKSGKPLVFKNMGMDGVIKKEGGSGEWFFEDFGPDRDNTLFISKNEKCWARQYNSESYQRDMIRVDGGQLWMLGMKTEGRATHLIATNKARVEILGGLSYQSWVKQKFDPPMFTIIDSDVSLTYNLFTIADPFTTIISETRNGTKKSLLRTDVQNKNMSLPLYRAWSGK